MKYAWRVARIFEADILKVLQLRSELGV